MKKRAAVLCMLAGLLMLLSGCMAGEVRLVDMSVEQPDPVSGKYQTLAPDQNGLTSGQFLFLVKLPGGTTVENNPALDSTINDVTLGEDVYFTILNVATQKQYQLTNVSLARDPSVSYVRGTETATECQLGLLVAYANIDPGSYRVTDMDGSITYRTKTGTYTQSLRGNSLGQYSSYFSVVTPTPNPTDESTATVTATPTPTATAAPTATPTGTATPTPTSTATVTPTAMPTVTPFVPPMTGDNAAPWTWGVLLLVCGAGLLLIYRRTRS